MPALYEPIVAGIADLVVGSRVLGEREKGALLPQARFGNWLSTRLIRWLFGVSFTDLGPFRAIDHKALKRLDMCDRDFGWTVEMQVKAARLEMRCIRKCRFVIENGLAFQKLAHAQRICAGRVKSSGPSSIQKLFGLIVVQYSMDR